MKLSNNALNFLLAQYRAIFKRAYVKGLASAVILTAGLAAGQAQAVALNEGSFAKASDSAQDITIDVDSSIDLGKFSGDTFSGTWTYLKNATIDGAAVKIEGDANRAISIEGKGGLTIQNGGTLEISNTNRTNTQIFGGIHGNSRTLTVTGENSSLKATSASINFNQAKIESGASVTLGGAVEYNKTLPDLQSQNLGSWRFYTNISANANSADSGTITVDAATLNLNQESILTADKTFNVSGSTINFAGAEHVLKEDQDGNQISGSSYATAIMRAGTKDIAGTLGIAAKTVGTDTVKSKINVQDNAWGALYANTISIADTDVKIGSGATFIIDGNFKSNNLVDEGTHNATTLTLDDVTFDNNGTAIIGNAQSGGTATVSGTTTLTGNVKNYAQVTVKGEDSNKARLIVSANQVVKAADATTNPGWFAGASGSIIVSGGALDAAVLELVGSETINLNKDINLTSGSTAANVGLGQIGIDGSGTLAGEHFVLTDSLSSKLGTEKLALDADVLEIGKTDGLTSLSGFGVEQFTAHDNIVLEGSGTEFTVDKAIILQRDFYQKDESGDYILGSDGGIGTIRGDNLTLGSSTASGTITIDGGAFQNVNQSLTLTSGTLTVGAALATKTDGSEITDVEHDGTDGKTPTNWDYYKNANPASLKWNGTFEFKGASDTASNAAVKVTGVFGGDATLDLTDATIVWGAGQITLSGVVDSTAGGDGDPYRVSKDDYFARAGQGILKLTDNQMATYLGLSSTAASDIKTKMIAETGGLILVEGGINQDINFSKFEGTNTATSGSVSLSGGMMFATGDLSLVTGVNENGQASAEADDMKSFGTNGVLGAYSIDINNRSTTIAAEDKGTEADVVSVSGGTLAVASRLSSDNHTIAFNSGAGLILDTNGFLAQYDATTVGDSGTVDVERLVFNGAATGGGDKSKLDVQTGDWTIGSLTNLGDIDLQGGAELNVGPGYEEYVRTGVGASLTADNLGVSDASTKITIDEGGNAKFNTVQAAGATIEVGDGATLEITGIVNTGDFDTDGSVKDNAPDTLADIGDAADVKAQAGINLDGTNITVNGGTFILGDTAARTLIALDASSGAADAVSIKTGLEGAKFTLNDGASLRLDFTKTEADGENPINGIAGVNGGVALTAAQAKELKEELIYANGGQLNNGSYINVGDLALGMEYDSGTMTADWDKIKDFVQIESDVTNDVYIQLLIKNAQDGLTGQFGAVETSKNTTMVEGSLGLHKAYADNGTGEKFFASQVVNGTRQAAGLTVTNNSTLSLYGEGTVGTLQGAGTDSDSVVQFKAGDLQPGETVVKPINKNSLAISDMGRIVAENNVRVEGSAEAGSIEVNQNFSATNLELDGAAGDSSTVYGTLDIAETLTLSTKGNGSNSLLIANGQVKANTTVLADNSTLQVGRDALAAQDDPDTTEIDESASYSGVFETTNFAMNGGLLIVDPEYGDATALASIRNFAGVSDAQYTDQSKVGTADGSIFVGQNSALGIGTESAADLAQVIAQYQTNGSLSGAADKLGAIVYLDGIATVDAGQGIVMTNKSLAGFVDYYNGANGTLADISESDPTIADTIFFGDGTAMLATAEAITAAQAQNTALVTFDSSNGKLVADGGEILITGDLRGNTGYKLFADKGTGTNGDWITVVDVAGQNVTSGNGITVTTENGFLVGEINNENGGTVTLGLADDARARMSGASDPVYTTLVAYFNGYNSKYDDGKGNISYDYIGTPTADADGDGINDSNYQYSNAFLAEAIAQGNGAAAETAARFGVYGGAPQAAIQAGKSSTDAIAQRFGIGSAISNLTLAGNTQGAALWLAPVYKSSDSDGFEAQGVDYGVNVDLYGVALGADYTLANGITFGAMFNVGSGEVDGEGAASSTTNDFDYYGFGLYAGYTMGQFSVVGDVSYTSVDNDLEGSTSIDRIGASMDSTNLSIGVTGKYELSFNGVDITPHAGLRFSNIDLDDYTIDGNDVIASADSDDMSIFSIPVGVTIAKEFKGETWTVAPSFDLTLTGQFGDDELDGSVSWAGVSNLSTHTTTEVFDNFTYGATLGVEAQSVSGVALGISVGYTGSSNTDELGVNANARFVF